MLGVREQGLMEDRRQRCALSAQCHVGAAKIGDGGNAGPRRNEVGITQLQRGPGGGRRAMAHGLAVTADGAYLVGLKSVALEQIQDATGKQFAQFLIQRQRCIE